MICPLCLLHVERPAHRSKEGGGGVKPFDQLCQLAIERWGESTQIDMAIEEMAELTVALQHLRRGRPAVASEEIADVEIMMGQLRAIFGNSNVDRYKMDKLERLNTLLSATPKGEGK